MSPMRDNRRRRQTTEDRATQPMEAGGWVSQYFIVNLKLSFLSRTSTLSSHPHTGPDHPRSTTDKFKWSRRTFWFPIHLSPHHYLLPRCFPKIRKPFLILWKSARWCHQPYWQNIERFPVWFSEYFYLQVDCRVFVGLCIFSDWRDL